jgi:hypothetical protein
VRYSQPSIEGADVRRNQTLAIALGLTLLTAACGGGGDQGSSLGPVPTGQPTGNASPTTSVATITASPTDGGGVPTPTTTPATGSLTQGTASRVVTGGLQTSQPAIPLTSPAIYAPPPRSFALNWASAGAGFALAGATFVGSRPTSDVMRLSFFVHASSGTDRFTSIDGGCSVTVVEPPDATSFSGTFACGSLADESGTITVAAHGAFLASE